MECLTQGKKKISAIDSEQASTKFTCTVITANNPSVVTKQFYLDEKGELAKITSASIVEGEMNVTELFSPTDFVQLLTTLNPSQCLAYGTPAMPQVSLVTADAWQAAGKPTNPLPRTAEQMPWSAGGAVFMLDYDPPKGMASKPFSRQQLLDALTTAFPEFSDVTKTWWPSTSSHIFKGEVDLTGLRGQRIYLMIKEGTDIPRAGKAIQMRLWGSGFGHYEVSKAGTLLEKGLFDSSVWQSNHIDFAAGANCHDGLVQKRGDPLLIQGSVDVVDSRKLFSDPTPDEIAKAESFKAIARAAKQEEAKQVREKWLAERIASLQAKHPGLSHEDAKVTALKAAESSTLTGNWLIRVIDGVKEKEVSVQEILDNPAAYHKTKCLDPLEPEYDGRRVVGIIYTTGSSPCLHSMAHGGTTYRLIRQPVEIELYKGNHRKSLLETMVVLEKAPELYDFGDEMVVIRNNGQLLPLDQHSVAFTIAGHVQYYRMKPLPGGGEVAEYVNPPPSLCNQLLSLRGVRKLKKLRAVITAPTIRPDGTIISKPGFDAATGLYLQGDNFPVVPECPTQQQAAEALAALMKPFDKFPFASPLSRAAHLAAVITAAIRPILDRAPGFAYDAPVQGSGKTLLAKCVAVIGTGREPTVWPNTAGRDDEEMRKRLYAALRAGDQSIILDNIIGTFDSAAMAALLTSDHYRDRILGKSVAMTIPNTTTVMLTGNNIALAGDMPRRILISRIDPNSEKPFEREFDFDPVTYCTKHRLPLVAAVLTLLRYYTTTCKTPPGKGQVGSFEMWDRWVRQPIIYINQALAPDQYGDVLDQLRSNQVTDPEQETWHEFLSAWYAEFGDMEKKASDILTYYKKYGDKYSEDPLIEAIATIPTGNRPLNAKRIGWFLRYRLGRIAGGLRLEKGQEQDHTSTWRVVKVEKPNDAETGFAGFQGSNSPTSKSTQMAKPKSGVPASNQQDKTTLSGKASAGASKKPIVMKPSPTMVIVKPKKTIAELAKTNPANPANPADDYSGDFDGLL